MTSHRNRKSMPKNDPHMNSKVFLSFLLSALAVCSAQAQHAVGIFENSIDIGNPKVSGSAGYDESTQSYTIKGGGSNIWFNRDEFHFVYKRLKGDFIVTPKKKSSIVKQADKLFSSAGSVRPSR